MLLQGIYPTVVVVCISLQRTKDRTLQWPTSIRPSEPVAGTIPTPAVSELIQVAASEPSGIEAGVVLEDEMKTCDVAAESAQPPYHRLS